MSTIERVLLSISDQFDQRMRALRITQLKLSLKTGRTGTQAILRVLKAKGTRVATLVELADALDCDVRVSLVPRAQPPQSTTITSGTP